MGCDINSAKGNAHNYLEKHPQIRQRAIDIIQQQAGLTLQDALDVVKQGMKADYTGKYGTQADYVARLEASKVLLRLYGELTEGQTKSQTLIQSNTYNIINDIGIDKLRELIAEVKHMNEHATDISDGEIVS
jgi:hypothetical protein